jgi:hypothetical protein
MTTQNAMTLQELGELAERLGATVIPDEVDGPEFIFDADQFEAFADAIFMAGTDHGLSFAQRLVDSLKSGGAK